MSVFSSLDALEAVTDVTTAPRAAVFQPKVKPRARKGGGGRETRSVVSTAPPAPPREIASEATADPSPRTAPDSGVTTSSETFSRVSGLKDSLPTSAQFASDVKYGGGEQPSAGEVVAIPRPNDTEQNCAPEVHVATPEVPIAQQDDLSTDEPFRAQESRPPVATRSNFPLPQPTSGGSSRRVDEEELAARSSPEQDPGVTSASEPTNLQDREESDLPSKEKNPSPARNRKDSNGGGVGSKRRTARETRFPVKVSAVKRRKAVVEEEEEEEEAEEADAEADVVEPVSEVLSTGKKGRKRAFSHTTSQPRMKRKEREEMVPKIDFSKTDLSNPGKLTMREIIRRAEAIERKKVKSDLTKKNSTPNDGKRNQGAIAAAPGTDAVSMAPQVQVINGRIVINEQSLTVGAYATTRQDTDTYTRVEETASRLNYNSYSNRTPTERWKSEDTDVFYMALQQFGTDFELIQNLFPRRTRRQVKAKFKKEERNNPKRLQDALAHRPKDQVHYTDMINRLKADEPDPNAEDPFTGIHAFTNNPTEEIGEQTDVV